MFHIIKQHNPPYSAKIVFSQNGGILSATLILKDPAPKKIDLPLPSLCGAVRLKPDGRIAVGEVTAIRLKKPPLRFNNAVLLSFFCGPGTWVVFSRKRLSAVLRDYGILPPKKKKSGK